MNAGSNSGGDGWGLVLAVALNLAALRKRVHASVGLLPVWSGLPVEAGSQLQ
jgi:hypothetical protein